MEKTDAFYMANLGSEMMRAFSFLEKGEKVMSEASILRCINIINGLLADSTNSSLNKEIIILNNMLENILHGNSKKYSISKKDLEIYFNPFALRAMSVSR